MYNITLQRAHSVVHVCYIYILHYVHNIIGCLHFTSDFPDTVAAAIYIVSSRRLRVYESSLG